jgi:hypothetical protein
VSFFLSFSLFGFGFGFTFIFTFIFPPHLTFLPELLQCYVPYSPAPNPLPDAASIRAWHSNTFAALASRPGFENDRASLTRNLTASLAKMLSIFKASGATPTDNKDFNSSIEAKIITPAVELAEKLQLSTEVYSLQWTQYVNGQPKDQRRGRSMADAELYECVNLSAGGKVIDFAADKKQRERERITYVLDICPGLYVQSVKTGEYSEARVLKKGKILVAMPSKEQEPFQMWTPAGEEATLLGAMEKVVRQRKGWLR